MSSYQRVALFILFDSVEHDLSAHIRAANSGDIILTDDEKQKASERSSRQQITINETEEENELVSFLDLTDKLSIIQRSGTKIDKQFASYLKNKRQLFDSVVSVRNATMHGRPLTTKQYTIAFSFAEELIKAPQFWPNLSRTMKEYDRDPQSFLSKTINIIEDKMPLSTLHNLPGPDYDDTGFLSRPILEADLRKKILGRAPVITVLGDGGNGKSALALQTLYGLVESEEHDFEAVLWVTAKANRLTTASIVEIEGAFTSSFEVFGNIADLMEKGQDDPLLRVHRLLKENKILLAIDNLETVLDDKIKAFSDEVPGQSKLLFTSRVPLGGDQIVEVQEMTASESRSYLRSLINAYSVTNLQSAASSDLEYYAKRLLNKPLLLKWFILAVASGISPDRVVANPQIALKFCLENVIERLSTNSVRISHGLNVLSRPVSMNILAHICNCSVLEAESGLSELARFGLLETSSLPSGERSYALRQFPRAYFARVAGFGQKDSETIFARFRQFEAEYQLDATRPSHDLYNGKNYVVRTRGEFLAAKKLGQAAMAALRREFDDSYAIISELKISMPSYFEVYRVEGFIANEAGDFSRAIDAYESALVVDSTQSQLHYFFAGFLMRFNEFSRASEHFQIAAKLDDNSSILMREAARNEMLQQKFVEAQGFLDKAKILPKKRYKDNTIIADIQFQIFSRKAEQRSRAQDYAGMIESLEGAAIFSNSINAALMDERFCVHLEKAIRLLLWATPSMDTQLRERARAAEMALRTAMSKFDGLYQKDIEQVLPGYQNGFLKREGQKPNYGFIRNYTGVEIFVHKDDTTSEIWEAMKDGQEVVFRTSDVGGKKRATDIMLR